ncbi:hypothetical protein Tco_1194180 [Tanacetum coccineum]
MSSLVPSPEAMKISAMSRRFKTTSSLLPFKLGRINWCFHIAVNEQSIRLLLKEQSDSFTSQIATLTKELQSAKASVWTRHGSGNSDQGIPCSMRLDVRAFPDTRKFAIKEYFELLETTPEQRLRIIGFNLEGDNAKWYRCMTYNKLARNGNGAGLGLGNHPPSPNPISKPRPKSAPIPNGDLIGALYWGEMLPQTRSDPHWRSYRGDLTSALLHQIYAVLRKPPSLPTPIKPTTTTTTKTTPLAIKWISSAERQECLNKGLCFNGDNYGSRLIIVQGKIFVCYSGKEENNIGADNMTEEDEAVKSGDISILNSLIGHGSSWFLQL